MLYHFKIKKKRAPAKQARHDVRAEAHAHNVHGHIAEHEKKRRPEGVQTHAKADDGWHHRKRRHYKKGEGASERITIRPDKGEEGRKLALFDFDGTLIEQDSLDMLIGEVCGGKWISRALLLPCIFTAWAQAVFTTNDYMDFRSALKAHWIRATLKGRTVEEVEQAARRVKDKLNWRDELVDDIKRYAEEGMDVVIATGAVDVYLRVLISHLPVTMLICAVAEVKDGRLTGCLTGERDEVNPVRGEKRLRCQLYIRERGPFVRVVGYGNMPDDGPMLALCDEFYVV